MERRGRLQPPPCAAQPPQRRRPPQLLHSAAAPPSPCSPDVPSRRHRVEFSDGSMPGETLQTPNGFCVDVKGTTAAISSAREAK